MLEEEHFDTVQLPSGVIKLTCKSELLALRLTHRGYYHERPSVNSFSRRMCSRRIPAESALRFMEIPNIIVSRVVDLKMDYSNAPIQFVLRIRVYGIFF